MVHNLRSRNICKTSPLDGALHAWGMPSIGRTLAGTQLTTTPLNTISRASIISSIVHSTFIVTSNQNYQSKRHRLHKQKDQVEVHHHHELSKLIEETNTNVIENNNCSGSSNIDNVPFQNISTIAYEKDTFVKSNKSRYLDNLRSAIDDCVFKETFRKKCGVSLHRVKKSLSEDYHYDINRSHNKVREYILESIASGKMKQMSGVGARGTFRLNTKFHKRYSEARRKCTINKLRNVSSMVILRKRFKSGV